MSIDRGDTRRLTVTIYVGQALTDPASLTFRFRTPAGVETTYIFGVDAQIVHDTAGVFHADLLLDQAGPWTYQWQSTSPAQTQGDTLLVGPDPLDAQGPAPRGGACQPWVAATDVAAQRSVAAAIAKAALPAGDAAGMCQQAARAASDILYELSGRMFTGACGPVTIRPVSRPTDGDFRGSLGSMGYFSSWGSCGVGASSYGFGETGARSHYGCSNPPEIELGVYPVTTITEVKIDGVVIPADEYLLADFRTLVRMLPAADAPATQRYGFPTCQRLDLPDTEPGTFSVTMLYGQPPPAGGVAAALALAEFLILPSLGDCSKFPTRVTNITRQGVSAQVASVMDIVKDGKTGVYPADLWLMSVNPNKLARPAAVWSPDTGRPRRYPNA